MDRADWLTVVIAGLILIAAGIVAIVIRLCIRRKRGEKHFVAYNRDRE